MRAGRVIMRSGVLGMVVVLGLGCGEGGAGPADTDAGLRLFFDSGRTDAGRLQDGGEDMPDAAAPMDARGPSDGAGDAPCICPARACAAALGCGGGGTCAFAMEPDGSECADGVCLDGRCRAPGCGNGWRESGEVCDDGTPGDGPCSDACEPVGFDRPGELVLLAAGHDEVLAVFLEPGTPGRLVAERFADSGRSRGRAALDAAIWPGVRPRPAAAQLETGSWMVTWRGSGEHARAPVRLAALDGPAPRNLGTSPDSTEDVALVATGDTAQRWVVRSDGRLRREHIDDAGRIVDVVNLLDGAKEVAAAAPDAWAAVVGGEIFLGGALCSDCSPGCAECARQGPGRDVAVGPGRAAWTTTERDVRGDIAGYEGGLYALAATDDAERDVRLASGATAHTVVQGGATRVQFSFSGGPSVAWHDASSGQVAAGRAGVWFGAARRDGTTQLAVRFDVPVSE